MPIDLKDWKKTNIWPDIILGLFVCAVSLAFMFYLMSLVEQPNWFIQVKP